MQYLQLDEKSDNQPVINFFRGKGYFVYADPTDASYSNIIIADRTVTYDDFKRLGKRFGLDREWWDDETDFNSRLQQELPEA